MPEVETAECRTATKAGDITFTFDFDVATSDVSASNSVDITYSDCGSDLKTAYKAKTGVAGVQAEEDKIDAYLVTDCAADLTNYLNDEQFLHQGQHATKYITPDPAKWSDIVVGEGIYFQPPNIDPIESDKAFRDMVDMACEGNTRHCIIRRTCASCRSDAHKDIYYKRISPLPPKLEDGAEDAVYFLDQFMNQWTSSYNVLGTDFKLFSTYEDALNDTNEWTYCNYDYPNVGFPRDCGPTGYVGNEWNSYVRGGAYADHHGFYVEILA
jgi:hypothetical protein